MLTRQQAEFIRKTKECIRNGSEQDFADLEKEHKDTYFTSMGFFPLMRNEVFEKISDEYILAFAVRYPKRFADDKLADDQRCFAKMVKELIIMVTAGDSDAYTIAELIADKESCDDITDIISAAVYSENYEFFDYFVVRSKIDASLVDMEMVRYLIDNEKYDVLDKLLVGASAEGLANISVRNFRGETVNKYLRYYYEIGQRYLPVTDGAENKTAAVSDYLNSAIMNDILAEFLNTTRVSGEDGKFTECFSFMREHGLKFKNLSCLAYIWSGRPNSKKLDPVYEQVLRKYILPLADDEVYVSLAAVSSMSGNEMLRFIDILDIFGTERVYIDFTDNTCIRNSSSMYMTANILCSFEDPNFITFGIEPVLKTEVKLRVDDDISVSMVFRAVIRDSITLKYVLGKKEFTAEQLDMMTEECIKNKYYDSLNVIRKYLADSR